MFFIKKLIFCCLVIILTKICLHYSTSTKLSILCLILILLLSFYFDFIFFGKDKSFIFLLENLWFPKEIYPSANEKGTQTDPLEIDLNYVIVDNAIKTFFEKYFFSLHIGFCCGTTIVIFLKWFRYLGG